GPSGAPAPTRPAQRTSSIDHPRYIVTQRGNQPRNGVLVGLDMHREAEFTRRVGGDGTDGGDPRAADLGTDQLDEVANSGAGGEGDQIDLPGTQPLTQLTRIGGIEHRPVGDDVVHLGTALP